MDFKLQTPEKRQQQAGPEDLLDEDIFAITIGPCTYDIGWYVDHFQCKVIVNEAWDAPHSVHVYRSALECLGWLSKMLGYATLSSCTS